MDNCYACGRIEKELVAIDNTETLLCQNCYDDGIVDSNMYLALYYSLEEEKLEI